MNQNLLPFTSGQKEGGPSDVPHPLGLQCELLCTLSSQLLLGRAGLVLWQALASADLLPSLPGPPLPLFSGDRDNISPRRAGGGPGARAC